MVQTIELPENVQARIKKEAAAHSKIEPFLQSPFSASREDLLEWAENDYSAGAMTEAERAVDLLATLEKIKKEVPAESWYAKIVDKALNKYNQ